MSQWSKVGSCHGCDRACGPDRARVRPTGSRSTGHHAWQIRLALDHLRWREPIRPFFHPGDALGARPGEAVTAHANAVAHRLAVPQHEIKIGIRRIDDDRARRLLGGEINATAFSGSAAVPSADRFPADLQVAPKRPQLPEPEERRQSRSADATFRDHWSARERHCCRRRRSLRTQLMTVVNRTSLRRSRSVPVGEGSAGSSSG